MFSQDFVIETRLEQLEAIAGEDTRDRKLAGRQEASPGLMATLTRKCSQEGWESTILTRKLSSQFHIRGHRAELESDHVCISSTSAPLCWVDTVKRSAEYSASMLRRCLNAVLEQNALSQMSFCISFNIRV